MVIVEIERMVIERTVDEGRGRVKLRVHHPLLRELMGIYGRWGFE